MAIYDFDEVDGGTEELFPTNGGTGGGGTSEPHEPLEPNDPIIETQPPDEGPSIPPPDDEGTDVNTDGGNITLTIPVTVRVRSTTKIPIDIPITVRVNRNVTVPVATRIYESISDFIKPIFDDYYDQRRMGKTLLNYREDEQYSVLNWKSIESEKIALRLKNQLPSDKSVGDRVHVSRELQNSYYDVINFIDLDVQPIPQLRPATPNVSIISKNNRVTATLSELIPEIAGGTIVIASGSVTESTNYANFVTNQVLEKYYNTNRLNAGIINVDYTDFSNFVTFSSALKRIDVFREKLGEIQRLVKKAPIFVDQLNISASADLSGSYDTVFGTLEIDSNGSASLVQSDSATYSAVTGSFTSQDYVNSSIVTSKQIQELIRSFDDYEKTLWFANNLPYSASNDTDYHPDIQYLEDLTYPKILGIPFSTTSTSGSLWYQDISEIAVEYDESNEDTLSKNVPMYLQDDNDSIDFSTFVDMVGHHFDNIKLYIQNAENIYSRYPKVDKELSGELSARVLESFGASIPNAASVENLLRYVTGQESGSVSYEVIANEYYKRYMHALPFLLKSKGTKQSVNSLLNVFGINPNLITVRESLSNRYVTPERARVVSSEQDFALNVVSGSYLSVPMSASLRTPQTIQARLALNVDKDQSIFVFGDGSYTLDAIRHPSASSNTYYENTGRIDLVSSSVSLITSSYFDLFDENYVSLQLKSGSTGVQLDIGKIEDEEFSFTQSLVEPELSMSADWPDLDYVYIGSPIGSSSLGYSTLSLDEFRLWGEETNDDVFLNWVEHPGSYAGNGNASSVAFLYVRLSFTTPSDVGTDNHIPNETKYRNKTDPLNLSLISASNFPVGSSPLYNTDRLYRTSIELSYRDSSNQKTTQMIKIAPEPPVSGTLSSAQTVVPITRKFTSASVGSTNVDISISPVDSIDREIVRAYGDFNIGASIGQPEDRNEDRYPRLDILYDVFVREIAPVIDYNAFLKYFDKFLKLFNEVVEEYIPARARLTKGIVIRSPILDRSKINNRTNVQFSGETARRNDVSEIPEDVVRSYDVTYNITESLSSDVQGDFNTIEVGLQLPNYSGVVDEIYVPLGEREDYSGSLKIRDEDELDSDVEGGYNQDGFADLFFDLTRPEKEQEVQILYNPTADDKTEVGGDVNVIGPVDDIVSRDPTDIDKYTYFTSPYGLYYFDKKRLIPVTESFMPTEPTVTTWSAGSTYKRGDVVLQPDGLTDDNGDEYSKNGKYFVFIDPGYSGESYVTSFNVPQLDTQLWSSLRYRPQIYQGLKRVAYVNNDTGSLSILSDLGASYTDVPIEYTEYERHFKFHREQTLGARRRTYLGTLNTVDGTVDGKPPYQVFDLNINEIQVGGPDTT